MSPERLSEHMTKGKGHTAQGAGAYKSKPRGGNKPVCKDNTLHLQGKRNPGLAQRGGVNTRLLRGGKTEYSAWVRSGLELR